MSTELATVVSTENGIIKVVPERQSSCGGCSAQKSCGISVLSNLMGKKTADFNVLSNIEVKTGDKVIISLKDSVLLQVSLIVYILPMLFMIFGAIAGKSVFYIMSQEPAVITGALCGLVLGLIYSRLYFNAKSHYSRFHPVIISKTYPDKGIS